MAQGKRGRVSAKEARYVRDNVDRMSVAQIADFLGKSEPVIQKYVDAWKEKDPSLAKSSDSYGIKEELRGSQMWKILAQEFSTDEMLFFEEQYVKLMSQFRGDVLATEESDVFHVIKYEILMHRNLVQRKNDRNEGERLERAQTEYLKSFGNDPSSMDEQQREYALSLEKQIESMKSVEQNRTNEYVKLQKCRDDLLKTLKATRDQRVQKIENSKVSFLGLIKSLQEKDVQAREGREAALMKLAGEKEYNRLGHAVTYEDGQMDNPILSANTVDFGPLEEDEA